PYRNRSRQQIAGSGDNLVSCPTVTRVGAGRQRGVGTTSEGLPGIMIVLVPVPLFRSRPGTGQPGIRTDRGEPVPPDTRPEPRDVAMPGDAAMEGPGNGSAG